MEVTPRRVPAPDAREYWVNKAGVVEGPVRLGKPREDKKEYEEREKVEKLVEAWGWPVDSTNIERPHGGGTYEFDCTSGVTGERVAVEVKRITWPPRAMSDLASTGRATFNVSADLLPIPTARVHKANDQLAGAPKGVRRCVLLAWDFEPMEGDPEWDWLVAALSRVDVHSYENVDEVWLTTSHLTQFFRWEFADRVLRSPDLPAI